MWVEKHGGAYRIRDRVAGQIVTLASGYPTKAAAKDARTLLEADRLRGDQLAPRGGQTTVAQLAQAWWPDYERSLAVSARTSEHARLRHHILPLLGGLRLDEVDDLVVAQWVRALEDGVGPMGPASESKFRRRPPVRRPLSPKSVANCHGLLFVMMRFAVEKLHLIRTNPCKGTTLPERVPREMRFLSDAEVERLLTALPEWWRPLALLLVLTGLRWGEAVGLKVGRVKLHGPRPSLRVEEQLQELPSTGDLVFCSPKTLRSRRTVSFVDRLAAVLAPLVAGKAPGDMLFTTVTGKMVRTRRFRKVWLAATRAAGLEGVRVHDMRHTHVAMLLSAGVPIEKISRRLGHASIQVTDVIYGHLREGADEEIMVVLRDTMDAIGWRQVEEAVAAELADEWGGELPGAA